MKSNNNKQENKLKESVFFVEATSNEIHNLWREYKNVWSQDAEGFSQIIGYIDKKKTMCVNVCFTFNFIKEKRVCFYQAISRYVDHNMVENFIKKNYPVKYDNGSRVAMTNADNFHHVINAIDEIIKNENKFQNCDYPGNA